MAALALSGCQSSQQAAWQDSPCAKLAECPHVPCRPATDSTPRVYLMAGTANQVPFYVEVADTPEKTSCGLMDRQSLASDWGMLFVFATSKPRSFWMSRTGIALDLIFASETGQIVAVTTHAVPYDETPRYQSTLPARYVLEVQAGTIDRLHVQIGQRLTLQGVPGSHHADILH